MDLRSEKPLDTRVLSRLRAEHRRVLRGVSRLERALHGGGGGAVRTLHAFTALLARPFLEHLATEERDTFPRLARAFPELGGTLARLIEEHVELRAMVADLHAQLARPSSADRDERLFVLGSDLAELLRLHIHVEEQAAFAWIERLVPHARRRRPGGTPKTH